LPRGGAKTGRGGSPTAPTLGLPLAWVFLGDGLAGGLGLGWGVPHP